MSGYFFVRHLHFSWDFLDMKDESVNVTSCMCVCISFLIIALIHAANSDNIWFDTFGVYVCVCVRLSLSRSLGNMMECGIHLVLVDARNESKFTSLPGKLAVSHLGVQHPRTRIFNQDSNSPQWKFHGKKNHVCCLHLRSWWASLCLFCFVPHRYQKTIK